MWEGSTRTAQVLFMVQQTCRHYKRALCFGPDGSEGSEELIPAQRCEIRSTALCQWLREFQLRLQPWNSLTWILDKVWSSDFFVKSHAHVPGKKSSKCFSGFKRVGSNNVGEREGAIWVSLMRKRESLLPLTSIWLLVLFVFLAAVGFVWKINPWVNTQLPSPLKIAILRVCTINHT